MRKIAMTAVAILLILTMALNGYAAEEKMTLSDAEGVSGATVFLTMTLHESVKGDALAVSYTYDPEFLEPLIDSHAWSKTGMLQDFDYKHVGVWADGSVTDFDGPVCVLAFRIRDGKSFRSTKVGCTLKVKNGASDVGTYTAEATVSMACSHVFGNWANVDAFSHTRTCETCGQKQTQSHIWDDGVLTDNPDNEKTEIKTYTCTVCGGTRQVEVSVDLEEQVPTVPGEQEPIPTIPPSSAVTIPKETQPKPTNPDYSGNQGNTGHPGNNGNQGGSQNSGTGNQGGSNNQGGSSNPSGSQNQGNTNSNGSGSNNQHGGNSQGNPGNQGSSNNQGSFIPQEDPAATGNTVEPEHDHNHGEETKPIAIPVVTNPNATTVLPTTEHTHDHEAEIPEQRIAPASVVAMVAFFAAAAGGLLIFLKKKR